MAEAQAKCDKMLADAKAQCSAMVQTAEDGAARQKVEADIAAEQERLEYAKQTALNFINVIEGDIKGHLELLEQLKGPRPDRRGEEAGAAEARQALRLAGRQRTVARGGHVQQAHAGHRGRDLRESRKARRQRAGSRMSRSRRRSPRRPAWTAPRSNLTISNSGRITTRPRNLAHAPRITDAGGAAFC